ncbi:hypothetical protein CHH80_10775 [Bacillus sp. 7504-2]|nr:hypothetical protein CHH80_10775 [Bacillus sp. 7504-2]
MNFIEYDPISGIVVQIYNDNPATIGSGNAVAQSDVFQIGDEFTNTLFINEVVDGIVSNYSVIRTNPQASRLLQENNQLKAENQQIKNDLDKAILELSMAIAMQGGA